MTHEEQSQTREALDRYWAALTEILATVPAPVAAEALRLAIAAERSEAERGAMARAIRWASDNRTDVAGQPTDLHAFADQIESGEVTVP